VIRSQGYKVPPSTSPPPYDFATDPKGPRGIAVKSWLERERLALIVVDVQNYITLPRYSGVWTADGGDPYYYPRLAERVLPNLRRLIRAFRALGRPVVYTRIAALNANLLDVPGLSRKVLAEETRDVHGNPYHLLLEEHASQIDERVAPAESDIVVCKTASGAFCSADTDSILRNNGVSRLVFAGGLTDACVASSVREGFDRGYLCTVAEDACIAASAEDHEAALRSLRKFYAWVAGTDEILQFLEK
jgi:nicotinamidase-related amidase